MALYGLSVFLETPKELRKGRTPYIVISFLISVLSALTASLDVVWIFDQLFGATSGIGFFQNLMTNAESWERFLSSAAMAVVIFVGDLLLVSSKKR